MVTADKIVTKVKTADDLLLFGKYKSKPIKSVFRDDKLYFMKEILNGNIVLDTKMRMHFFGTFDQRRVIKTAKMVYNSLNNKEE